MEQLKKYNRAEMEQRLPAYIFGELCDAEKEIFESSIADFPDILNEITEVRRTFELLNQIDFDKVLFDKTKDLPARVVRKVARSNKKTTKFIVPLRFLVPAIVTAAILFFAIKTGLVKDYWLQTEQKNVPKLTKEDKINKVINQSMTSKEIQELLTQSEELQLVNNETFVDIENEYIDKLYEDFVFNLNSYFTTANIPNIETFITIDYHLNHIDEQSFEQILEDIKNVNL